MSEEQLLCIVGYIWLASAIENKYYKIVYAITFFAIAIYSKYFD